MAVGDANVNPVQATEQRREYQQLLDAAVTKLQETERGAVDANDVVDDTEQTLGPLLALARGDKGMGDGQYDRFRPMVARAYSLTGFALQQASQRQKAEAARALATGGSEGLTSTAASSVRALTRVAECYRTALVADPAVLDARRNIIPVLFELGLVDEAEMHAELLTLLTPSDADAHFTMGVVKMRATKLDEAAEAYIRAIDKRHSFKEAYINLDACLLKLGRIDECRKYAARACRSCPNFWTTPMQRPPHFVSGLTSAPWHRKDRFPWIARLEAAWQAVREEGMAAMARAAGRSSPSMPDEWGQVGGRALHDSSLVANGDWRELLLFGTNGAGEDGRRQCPLTTSVLSSVPEIVHAATTGTGEVLFSVLAPGTHLRAHCGSTNSRLTAHLGIRIPENCTIRCGDETRTWTEGECIVFDDSYEHEVWHGGDSPRLVLLINFWHPDVPMSQWTALQIESKYSVA